MIYIYIYLITHGCVYFCTQEGKVDGEMIRVEELLAKVSKTRYTLAELLEIPPPEGVDPLKMESYLSDEEFEVSGFTASGQQIRFKIRSFQNANFLISQS